MNSAARVNSTPNQIVPIRSGLDARGRWRSAAFVSMTVTGIQHAWIMTSGTNPARETLFVQ
ncbi:MAG: hypothetical protein KDA28_09125, partial [Phycisphaerales bacterium]|nr:hypothetical protein [Phycisphaerales bacterium]